MTTTLQANFQTNVLEPERGTATPPPPQFASVREAADALRDGEQADDNESLIEEGEQMSLSAFEEAEALRIADIERLGNQRRELVATRARASRARSFLLRDSEPSTKEQELHERGIELQRKIGALKSRYRIYSSPAVDERHSPMSPSNSEKVRRQETINSTIADLDKRIARSKATPGTSAEEFTRKRLIQERESLAPEVDQIHARFRQWKEICALHVERERCLAERDELRAKREAAVIKSAMKAN